jgi:cell wall-associated NlpC family hydrolase
MRRLALLPLLALALVQPASGAKPKPAQSWAQPEIELVTSRGLMGGNAATFRPNDPLTQGALAQLIAALTEQPLVASAAPSAPVAIAQLDARLVGALGLSETASSLAGPVRAAGLKPPSRFGTEVVARLLGLRTNHPAAQDALELEPNDPATRAEAAFSAARILQFSGSEKQFVTDAAAGFTLPALTAWQQQVLRTAVSFIGFPYVWGGESETTTSLFGPQPQGGFDCSGFVWRVYKLQPYGGAPQLAETLRGRTTMEMSGEVPKAQRIGVAKLQPGDVVFFGSRGLKSKPGQIDHMGISLGNGWLIHSSGYGVALAPLDGWYAKRFAWARRPLAEAYLA